MRTNIPIDLTKDERLDLAQKYTGTTHKKLLTRKELTEIVQAFVQELIEADTSVKKTKERVVEEGTWTKTYFYEGKRVSEKEWNKRPNGGRKFYSYDG
jgi:hypothetical protein